VSFEKGNGRGIDNTLTGDLNPKTMTLRQASIRYPKSRPCENGRAMSRYTVDEYSRLVDKVLTQLADRPLRSITRDDVEAWHAGVFERTPTPGVPGLHASK